MFGRSRSFILVVAVALMSAGASALPASAAKAKKPGAPVIVAVTSKATSSKLISVTVFIEQPKTGGVASSTKISIRYSPRTCTIKGKATSCTIKKVSRYQSLGLSAVSQNKVGSSARSRSVNLQANSLPRWARVGYTLAGKKYPAAITARNGRVLKGTSEKWTKFQPMKRTGVNAASVRLAQNFQVDPGAVVFQTSNMVGLALPSSTSCGYGNSTGCAMAVAADGSTPDILMPGSAPAYVRDFHTAPNGRFYVVFAVPTQLTTGGTQCVLAEVNTETGIPTCVDTSLTQMNMGMGVMYGPATNGNPPIQFDASGNIYYSGQVNGQFKLRKFVGGQIVDLNNENIQVRDFLVLDDGSVLVSGSTGSTQAWWIRKLTKTGAITNIANGVQANFLKKFADGNVYYGLTSSGMGGVNRYITATGIADKTPWISRYYSSGGPGSSTGPAPVTNVSSLCDGSGGLLNSSNGFCMTAGSWIKAAYNVPGGTTYVVAGMAYGGTGSQLMRYFPTVEPVQSVVSNVTLSTQVGSKLILAGTNQDGTNVLTVLDTETLQETIIFDATNEIEVYNMAYVASTNKLMFNGLNFADGSNVVGEVVLP
jgi:hypothetical protein